MTDRYGFIHNGNPNALNLETKPLGVFRIFVLGGSSAASYYAESNALTIPALLEGFLNEDDYLKRKYNAERFEVVNAAVGGYFSTQEFLLASLVLIRYQPDMFIVFDGYNDWLMSISRDWKPHGHAYARNLEIGVNRLYTVSGSALQLVGNAANVPAKLYKYSHSLFRYIRDKIRFERGKDTDIMYEDGKLSVSGSINSASIEVYRQNIDNLIGICEKNGIYLFYLLQPSRKVPEGGKELVRFIGPAIAHKNAYFAELEIVFNRLQKYNNTRKIKVASLTGIFDDLRESPFFVPHDLVHLNRLGNEIVAERIVDLLKGDG